MNKVLIYTSLTCVFCILSISAFSQNGIIKRISIHQENAPLEQILNEVKAKSNFQIFYNSDLVKNIKSTINFENALVTDILDKVIEGMPLTYSIENEAIVISLKVKQNINSLIQIKGSITDEKLEPLAGANIIVVGQSKYGTAADSNGNFDMKVPQEAAFLDVSFIGMQKQRIAIADKKELLIVLKADTNTISEVVVTGYSSIRSADYVGSAFIAKVDDIKVAGVNSLDNMLAGIVPGMMVKQSSGVVGSTPDVRIRGTSTLLGNQAPLWVVDGIIQRDPMAKYNNDNVFSYSTNESDLRQFVANAISWLNPNDVETITVLKDASATAIYGSAASNGVIVLTTKKAEQGKALVNYTGDLTVGVKPSYVLYDLMNSQEMMLFSMENYRNGMQYSSKPLDIGFAGIIQRLYNKEIDQNEFNKRYHEMELMNTDWFKLLFRNNISHNHNLSLSGGNDKIQSRISFGVNKTKGEARGNGMVQYTANSNTTFRFNRGIIATIMLKGSVRNVDGFSFGVNPFNYAYNTSRVIGAYKSDGDYVYHGKYGTSSKAINGLNQYNYNILNELDNTGMKTSTKNLGASIDLRVPIINGLQYKGLFSYNIASSSIKSWATERSNFITQIRGYEHGAYGANSGEQLSSPLPFGGLLRAEDTQSDSWTLRNDLLFDELYQGNHRITLQGGFEMRSSDNTGNLSSMYGYLPERGETFATVPVQYYNYGNTTGSLYQNVLINDMTKARQVINRNNSYVSGYFLGVYSYRSRYIINISARIDASNRFGQDQNKKWQPTWSAGVKWRLANEAFAKTLNGLNVFDLSLSYGYQGNAVESVSPFLIARTSSFDNYFQQYTMSIKSLPYNNLGWEKTNTINLGLQTGFFGNRLNLNFDYFNKLSDVLSSRNVPYENGSGTSVVTGVQIRNSGYEFIFNVVPVRNMRWNWQFSVNAGKAKNQMIHANRENKLSDFLNGTAIVNGNAYSTLYSVKFKGLSDINGMPLFDLGKNPDGSDYLGTTANKITENPLSYLVPTGKLTPDFNGGFNTKLSFKGWSIYTQFAVQLGGSGRLPSLFNYGSFDGIPYPETNVSRQLTNRWQNPGDEINTNIPSTPGINGNTAFQYLPSETNLYKRYEIYYYSDIRIARTDLIRCSQISVSYDFDKRLLDFSPVKFLTLRLSLSNPFFIAFDKSWNGVDPETGNWPARKSVSFSINASF